MHFTKVQVCSMCTGSGAGELAISSLTKAYGKVFGRSVKCHTPFVCENVASKQTHLRKLMSQLHPSDPDHKSMCGGLCLIFCRIFARHTPGKGCGATKKISNGMLLVLQKLLLSSMNAGSPAGTSSHQTFC